MTYRSADTAFEQRIDEARDQLRALTEEADELSAKIATARRELTTTETTIRERGANRLGIPTVVAALLVVAVLVVPLQISIAGYLKNERSDIVPILILCGPAALGAAVAFPYRTLGAKYRVGWTLGVVLVASMIAMIAWELVR